MNAQNYILQQLEGLQVLDKSIQLEDEEQIFRLITSKKFRKYSLDEEYKRVIRNVIHSSIVSNAPIHFVWVFGGYKLWSLDESPEADWAELFSMIYFVNWLKPILNIHKSGVVFDFFSDDVIVPLMNGISENETQSYLQSFLNLLSFINPYLPKGFTYSLNRVEDQYPSFEEFKNELDKNILTLRKEREINPINLSESQIAMLKMNVTVERQRHLGEDWMNEVQLIHDAYSKSSKRRPYYRNNEKIMVINTPITGAISIGTTKSSVVKFWVGKGVLEKREDKYIEKILSPKQISQTKLETQDVDIKGLKGKNFSKISIVV